MLFVTEPCHVVRAEKLISYKNLVKQKVLKLLLLISLSCLTERVTGDPRITTFYRHL